MVEPGEPAHQALVDRFGPASSTSKGVDRPRLAEVAFADPATVADLNAIVHPAIGLAMLAGKDAWKGTGDVVVMDIPLLKAFHRDLLALDAIIVVDVSPEVRMRRLVGQRGMSEDDVRARMAAQPSREERLEGADYVIDNSGDTRHLAREVDRVWDQLMALPQRDPVAEGAEPASSGPAGVGSPGRPDPTAS